MSSSMLIFLQVRQSASTGRCPLWRRTLVSCSFILHKVRIAPYAVQNILCLSVVRPKERTMRSVVRPKLETDTPYLSFQDCFILTLSRPTARSLPGLSLQASCPVLFRPFISAQRLISRWSRQLSPPAGLPALCPARQPPLLFPSPQISFVLGSMTTAAAMLRMAYSWIYSPTRSWSPRSSPMLSPRYWFSSGFSV